MKKEKKTARKWTAPVLFFSLPTKVRFIGLFVLLSLAGGVTVSANTYTYDGLNRLTSVTYEDGSTVTYDYDANGNITHITGGKKNEEEPSSSGGEPEPPKEEESKGGLAEAITGKKLQEWFQSQIQKRLEEYRKEPEEFLEDLRPVQAGFALLWKWILG